MQPDLGEVIGEFPPMQLRPRPRERFDAVEAIKRGLFAASGTIMVCVVLAVLFMAAMASASKVRAHDSAQWIQDGNYKNEVGELCCGKRDCFELPSDDVKVTAQGYYIISIKENVPFSESSPSPTGTYWRCQWGGMRKCFFAPPGQS